MASPRDECRSISAVERGALTRKAGTASVSGTRSDDNFPLPPRGLVQTRTATSRCWHSLSRGRRSADMARTRSGNAMIVGNLTGPLHGYIGRRSCRRTQLDDRNGYKIHAIAPFYAQQHRPLRSCPRFFDIATPIRQGLPAAALRVKVPHRKRAQVWHAVPLNRRLLRSAVKMSYWAMRIRLIERHVHLEIAGGP